MNFSGDISIDKNNLPDEWLRQADLNFKYGKLAAEAEKYYLDKKDEVEIAKDDWNIAKRRISLKVRRKEIDIQCNVTDKAVEDYREANLEQDCIDARNTYFDKKKELNQALQDWKTYEAAYWSIGHKKQAIETFSDKYEYKFSAEPRTKEQKMADKNFEARSERRQRLKEENEENE